MCRLPALLAEGQGQDLGGVQLASVDEMLGATPVHLRPPLAQEEDGGVEVGLLRAGGDLYAMTDPAGRVQG